MQTIFTETSRAFDAHATEYDAIVEPNPLLQTMRAALWVEVARRVPPPAHLLDLGCGTGIDAVHLARLGYRVTAIDPSREMVNQTRNRVAGSNLDVRVENMGAQELGKLGNEKYDAIYSDLGPLNCVPDLVQVSRSCSALLKPDGFLILSVMGRVCPWEILYYTARGDFVQAERRFPRTMVPVKLQDGIVWTRYYAPREFYKSFASEFQLVTYRALNLFLPPPYLNHWYQRAGVLGKPFAWLDAHVSNLPLLRDAGDHFLMTLSPRHVEQGWSEQPVKGGVKR